MEIKTQVSSVRNNEMGVGAFGLPAVKSSGIVSYHNEFTRLKIRLLNLIKKGCKVVFYSNFCVCNNETFNGITKELVEEEIKSHSLEDYQKELRKE